MYSIGSTGKSRMPCPSGTGEGYMYSPILNNTILLICDAAFNRVITSQDELELGLGFGLGLGLPVFLVMLWSCAYYNRIMCYDSRRSAGEIHTDMNTAGFTHTPESIDQTVKKGLSVDLYIDFIAGNLTVQLKKALFTIKETKGRPLHEYELYARILDHKFMADWIHNIKFTTLQDEEIV